MQQVLGWLRGCALVMEAVFLSGCIVSEETRVEMMIETNLTGTMVVEVAGVHSDSQDPEKRAKEFADYVGGGYVKEGESLASVFGIDNPVISITNQTATNCHLVVEGTFGNVVRSLSSMASEGDYEIKKADGYLIARFFMQKPKAEPSTGITTNNVFTFTVHYDGEIQDHNAHHFNQEFNAMSWYDSKMDESGIQFVLKVPEEGGIPP